jgi:hypothetical protein
MRDVNGIGLATDVGILAIVAPYQGPVVVDAVSAAAAAPQPERSVHTPRSAGSKTSSALLWDQSKQIVQTQARAHQSRQLKCTVYTL